MANVRFEVRREFPVAPRVVWDELVDWEGHAAWVPATRMEVAEGDPTKVGAMFTAFTGFGPLALEDRMRVARCDWSEAESSGDCEVEKIGPVLTGTAGFIVEPTAGGCVVNWIEDVRVPYAPQFVAPVLAWLGAAGFGAAMRKLGKVVAAGGAERAVS